MSDTPYFKTSSDGKIINIPPIKELCRTLEEKFQDQEDEIKRWKQRYKDLSESDTEYQRLKEKADEAEKTLHRGFGIYENESKAIDKWILSHREKCNRKNGNFTYKFTPTALGIIGEIECTCGDKFTFRELM